MRLVFLPVMPIGVEHECARNEDLKKHALVFLPVMPIGVEHVRSFSRYVFPTVVFLPVMPIGVEHVFTERVQYLLPQCVLTCDADRR